MCAQVGFNVELGGYFSVKRNTMSINGDTFVAEDQVVAYCKALLEVFRCRHLPLLRMISKTPFQPSACTACNLWPPYPCFDIFGSCHGGTHALATKHQRLLF